MCGIEAKLRLDLALCCILLLVAAVSSYIGSGSINPAQVFKGNDAWFQADNSRVYLNMADSESNHYRTKVHPLFSIATNPFVTDLRIAGFDPYRAVRIFNAVVAGLWLACLYLLLRLAGIRTPDALLFSMLGLTSSSFLFFATVPETFLMGSLSMLVVLIFVAASRHRVFSPPWYVAATAVSFSMTVTNGMLGIIATLIGHDWRLRQSLRIILGGLVAVTFIWTVQKFVYPSAGFFLDVREEASYVMPVAAGGLPDRLAGFFSHVMVLPKVISHMTPAASWPKITIERATIGSNGMLGLAASGVWLALLFVGALTLMRGIGHRRLGQVLGLTVIGQLGLHLIYGEEIFLYSLHWLPLLVVIAALPTLTRYRPIALAATALLLPLLLYNNVGAFASLNGYLGAFPG